MIVIIKAILKKVMNLERLKSYNSYTKIFMELIISVR
nr:MAG TPA: hypothetical protein [Caudoviricetes sp.]DAV73965.1 MAG TPA: hypothetical protein [Bacteriophage sp.]